MLHLLVGVERHVPRGPAHIADRHRHGQLPAPRLVELALVHPLLEQVQLGLAHGALEPQQQAVVVVRRIVEAVGVGEQRAEERAQLQQPVPVGVGAGQARHLHPQDEPDVVQADLRHQALEARPLHGTGPRLAQVVVDDQDAVGRPAQRLRPGGQPVLQPSRLLVVEHLLGGGLADVHHRLPVLVPRLHLLRAERAGAPPRPAARRAAPVRRHRCPPGRAPPTPPGAAGAVGSAPTRAAGGWTAGAAPRASPRLSRGRGGAALRGALVAMATPLLRPAQARRGPARAPRAR